MTYLIPKFYYIVITNLQDILRLLSPQVIL